jgi:hypothetical protein
MLLAMIVVFATVFISSVAMADGIGGGGNASGGGGHQSRYGWGWRLYSVSSTGPSDGFRNGYAWSSVQAACRTSSPSVAIFIVNDNQSPKTQMGYNYKSSWYGPPRFIGYLGDNGSPYLTMSQAKAGFDAVDPAVRAGYTFGDDVSWYCYGKLAQWATSGTSSVSASVVNPGTRVTWTHKAINQGPTKTDKAIRSTVTRTRTGSAASTTTGVGSSAGVAKNGTVASASRVYTTTLADAGKTLCERLNWTPNAYNSSGTESSSYKCVSVRFGGSVDQQLLFDPSDAVVDDSTVVNIKFNGINSTNVATSVNFDGYVWYDRNYNGVLDAGETKIFTKGGAGTLPASPTTTNVANYAETVNLTKGGRLCAYWNITATSPLVVNANAPDIRCTYIGFTPKLQAWGGDIRVGSSDTPGENVASLMRAHASTIKNGATTFYTGTWSEYGLFAPYDPEAGSPQSSIIDVASGAWPADGSASASANQNDWSKLTFGNKFSIAGNPTTANCRFGCFAEPDKLGLLPGIEDYLTQHGLLGSPKMTVRAKGAGTYTISSNITADGSGAPRIIIADDIVINESVTQVDAWLIARNSINTCQKAAAPVELKLGECKQTLRINGPVIAKTLIARRIGDVQADKKSVGEVVDLKGDDYIWAYKTTHAGTSYRTTGVKELPPRY